MKQAPAGVELHSLPSSGAYPNNQRLAVVVYRAAFAAESADALARELEQTFAENGWSSNWRDGVYAYHHYHSTAHEVLGCYAGQATVQVGGPDAPVVAMQAGDVLVLPAGTAHCSVEASADFRVVGAYAGGRKHNNRTGSQGDGTCAQREIDTVPVPASDPIYGPDGLLLRSWTGEQSACT